MSLRNSKNGKGNKHYRHDRDSVHVDKVSGIDLLQAVRTHYLCDFLSKGVA